MPISQNAWRQATLFHGHACPGLALGAAVALEAVRALGLDDSFLTLENSAGVTRNFSPDEELVCIAETDACGVDAIQALLGCTLGKGNLLLRLRGKHAFSFHYRPARKAVRILWTAPERECGRAERIQWFLSEEPGLFQVREIPFAPPEHALVSRSVPCSECGEATAEHMLRLRGGQPFCLDCFQDPSRILSRA